MIYYKMYQNCRGWGSAKDHARGDYSEPDTHDVCGWERKKQVWKKFTDRVGGAAWLCPRPYWE